MSDLEQLLLDKELMAMVLMYKMYDVGSGDFNQDEHIYIRKAANLLAQFLADLVEDESLRKSVRTIRRPRGL